MRALILALLFLSFSAWAEIIEFQAPTEREDGSALPTEEIQLFRVYIEDAATGEITIQDVDKTLTEAPITLEPKSWAIWMTTLDTDGRESGRSNIVQVIYPKSPVIIIVR